MPKHIPVPKFQTYTRYRKLLYKRGNPWIYIEGKNWLREAGFEPYTRIKVLFWKNHVTIIANHRKADRTVTSKKDGDIAVIDLNSPKIKFDTDQLQISVRDGRLIITPRGVPPTHYGIYSKKK